MNSGSVEADHRWRDWQLRGFLDAAGGESQVLQQVSHGLTNREIAACLQISYETVKEHVQHVLRKVGVSDRTQAALWAVRREMAALVQA